MKLFLTSIKNEKFEVSGQLSDEDWLFILIRDSNYQQRPEMLRNPVLDTAAIYKARDMAEKNYFAHTSPDGTTANENVRSVGYHLPDFYFNTPNCVESISIGGNSPEATVVGWYKSSGHRIHVFGEDKFYRDQHCIGIGSAVAKDGRPLYVFLSAPCQL